MYTANSESKSAKKSGYNTRQGNQNFFFFLKKRITKLSQPFIENSRKKVLKSSLINGVLAEESGSNARQEDPAYF